MLSKAATKLFVALTLSGVAVTGYAQDCSAPTSGIQVTSGIYEPVVHKVTFARTARELTREAAPDRSLADQAAPYETINGLTFGITRSGLSYSYRTGISYGFTQEGKHCARLSSVEYYLRLSPIKVSLAKELEGLACLSPRVQSHENDHVKIFIDMLKDGEAKRKIHEKLEYAVARIGVVVRTDKSKLHDEMDDLVEGHLRPMVKARGAVIFAVQEKLDSDFTWADDTRGCEADLDALLTRVNA